MHTDPTQAYSLVKSMLDDRRAQAAHHARLVQARSERRSGRWVPTARRAVGAALVRLGSRVEGTPVRRPATWLA